MKRPIKRGPYRKDLSALLPLEQYPKTMNRDLGQLRHENFSLRAENEFLRPLKAELARLRARIADDVYANSEKI